MDKVMSRENTTIRARLGLRSSWRKQLRRKNEKNKALYKRVHALKEKIENGCEIKLTQELRGSHFS